MLMVATRIAPSGVHGLGLFADEDIPAGAVIWRFTPGVDVILTELQVLALSEPARQSVLHYAYQTLTRGEYVLCSDDARFWNHSDNANTSYTDLTSRGGYQSVVVASRAIYCGEELTGDYREFDRDAPPQSVK